MTDEKVYITLHVADYGSAGVGTLIEDKKYIYDFNQGYPFLRKAVMAMLNNGLTHLSFRIKDKDKEYSLKLTRK